MALRGQQAASVLTFLIADVRGYTPFTQTRGDEAAAALAARFAEIARGGVEAHGGEVIELRGDEVLAVFQSARSALRAAVALQQTFADEVELDPSVPLRVGIGLDAGEAVPVEDGYRGAALNLAARLCSRAGPGEVLVSAGLTHLARAVDGVDVHERGEMELKGMADPVAVFAAVPAGAHAGALADRLERASAGAPVAAAELPAAMDAVGPIVGREREVRRLRWTWRRARSGMSTGAVHALVGPSGIGKTRLAAECAATAAANGARVAYASLSDDPPGALAALAAAAQAHGPVLLVADDVESAAAEDFDALEGLAGPRRLVIVAYDDERAPRDVIARVLALAGEPRVQRLPPLDMTDIRRIAELYLGSAVGALPASLLESTGGNPRRVHEQVAEWAHTEAARRLGHLADRVAAGRHDLQSIEEGLADSVVDLQAVRERARLFGAGPGRAAPTSAEAPYKGLEAFGSEDARWYFGREALVAEMIARLAGAPLLAVVGPSGSGKSSAVRAGLVPALRAGVLPGSADWTVALMRPGEQPLRALDRAVWTALPQPVRDRVGGATDPLGALGEGDRLIVVVDQFEEVFTACRDEAERRRFLTALTGAARDAARRVVVVLAVRADYYGRCAEDPGLADLIGANQVLVGPMDAAEYRRAIEQPALRAGARVEPELADRLVAEVTGEAGALPLLSTALLELWERRDGRTLRAEALADTGGVRGAVARLAEDVYGRLGEDDRRIARAMLLRLAGPGEGRAVTRRRAPRSELDAEAGTAAGRVLDVLVAGRLLTLDEGAVEVAHEALLREWPRFQAWLEEDREGRRLRLHLADQAREWADRDHDPAELYRGARLASTLDWTTEHTLELNQLERDFVAASADESRRELDRRQRQNRRLRVLLAGTVALLAIAAAAGLVALDQRSSARRETQRALAGQLGAEAVSEPRLDRAMLLAREGLRLDDSRRTQGTLLATLLRSPAAVGTFAGQFDARPQTVTALTGNRLLVSDNLGTMTVYDARTGRRLGRPLQEMAPDPEPVVAAAASRVLMFHYGPDSAPDVWLSVYDDGLRREVAQLRFDRQFLKKPTGPEGLLAISADGRAAYFFYDLVNGPREGPSFVDRWDIGRGGTPHRVRVDGALKAGRMTDDGHVAVLTDRQAVSLDPRSLRVLRRVPVRLPGSGIRLPVLDPAGRRIAWGTLDGTVGVRDLRGGQPVRTHVGGAVIRVRFSPDGRRLAIVGEHGTVATWAISAQPPVLLPGHGGRVVGVGFAERDTLYTSSLDGAIFRWDLGGSRRFGRPFRAGRTPPEGFEPIAGLPSPPLAVAPDSRRFAVRAGPGLVAIFGLPDARRRQLLRVPTAGEWLSVLEWSTRGVLAVGSKPGVSLWRMASTPRPLGALALPGKGDTLGAVAFSPDGARVAVGSGRPPISGPSGSGAVAVYDAGRRTRLGPTLHFGVPVDGLALSPDGADVTVGLDDGTVQIVDIRSGRRLRRLRIDGYSPYALTYLPDGDLLSGGWSGVVERWSPASGRRVSHPVLAAAAPVSSIALYPGARTFATAGGDGAVKLWDTSTLQQVGATFPGTDTWSSVRMTPDGRSLVQVNADATGVVWPATVGAWARHACQVAGRDLTREEWARYVGDRPYERTCNAATH